MPHFVDYRIRTAHRTQFINITAQVRDAVRSSGINEGLCVVFVPHTTAGVTVNENADPDVTADMALCLDGLVPDNPAFRHSEGNSGSHVKTTLVGPSITLIITKGQLWLGTWQAVYFCEFDGPRERTYGVKCMAG